MSNRYLEHWRVTGFVTALAFSYAAVAQEEPPRDPQPPSSGQIAEMVAGVLPPVITEDNTELVRKLMNPEMGTPLSESFDLKTAQVAVFGPRGRPTFDPDCRRLFTPSGDPDPGECTASKGEASGRGAYTKLSFSKHMGHGTIKMLRRMADPENEHEAPLPEPVDMTDAEAFEKAVDYLVRNYGLPKEEIPVAPAGAKNPYPVQDLVLGWTPAGAVGAAAAAEANRVAVRKVVFIKRGLFVDIKGEQNDLPYVPAPGEAIVMMDNSPDPWMANVNDWQELVKHPKLDPAMAKTRADLIAEITEDLSNINRAEISHMRASIQIASMPMGTTQAMLPAVQMTVSPVPRELTEEEQKGLYSSGGLVRDYMLVDMTDPKPGEGGDD